MLELKMVDIIKKECKKDTPDIITRKCGIVKTLKAGKNIEKNVSKYNNL